MIVYKIYHRAYKNPTLTKYTDTYTGEFLCTEAEAAYSVGVMNMRSASQYFQYVMKKSYNK